jgi:hypothetical protein
VIRPCSCRSSNSTCNTARHSHYLSKQPISYLVGNATLVVRKRLRVTPPPHQGTIICAGCPLHTSAGSPCSQAAAVQNGHADSRQLPSRYLHIGSGMGLLLLLPMTRAVVSMCGGQVVPTCADSSAFNPICLAFRSQVNCLLN